MGFMDWLLGTPKKRRVQSSVKRPTGGATPTGSSGTTVPSQRPAGKNVRIFETDQQQSQARDIVKDWLKEDS